MGMLHTRHRRLDIVMSRCGAAAINPVAVCRPGPPHPSYIPPLPRNPAPGPGLAAPHHRYWRHLQLHFACTATRRSLQQRQCEHCVPCIVYCVLLYLYIALSCVSVWWRGMEGCCRLCAAVFMTLSRVLAASCRLATLRTDCVSRRGRRAA